MLRAQKLFQLILFIYPRDFRRDFGPEMVQVFRDCYRIEEKKDRLFVTGQFWLRTIWDLARTAPKEHLDNLGKENPIMKNLRRDALALLGCVAIIAIAILLLSYGRRHEVSAILMFGYALDAIVTTGVVGNLIVFLLVKFTKLNPVRIALWVFLLVHAVPAILLAVLGSRMDPQFRLAATMTGYAISFVFWFGLHWLWSQRKAPLQPAV